MFDTFKEHVIVIISSGACDELTIIYQYLHTDYLETTSIKAIHEPYF